MPVQVDGMLGPDKTIGVEKKPNVEKAQLLAEVTKLLDCTVCFENARGPVYQCTEGHLLCEACWSRLNTPTAGCPTCAASLGRIRCRFAEQIRDYLQDVGLPSPARDRTKSRKTLPFVPRQDAVKKAADRVGCDIEELRGIMVREGVGLTEAVVMAARQKVASGIESAGGIAAYEKQKKEMPLISPREPKRAAAVRSGDRSVRSSTDRTSSDQTRKPAHSQDGPVHSPRDRSTSVRTSHPPAERPQAARFKRNDPRANTQTAQQKRKEDVSQGSDAGRMPSTAKASQDAHAQAAPLARAEAAQAAQAAQEAEGAQGPSEAAASSAAQEDDGSDDEAAVPIAMRDKKVVSAYADFRKQLRDQLLAAHVPAAAAASSSSSASIAAPASDSPGSIGSDPSPGEAQGDSSASQPGQPPAHTASADAAAGGTDSATERLRGQLEAIKQRSFELCDAPSEEGQRGGSARGEDGESAEERREGGREGGQEARGGLAVIHEGAAHDAEEEEEEAAGEEGGVEGRRAVLAAAAMARMAAAEEGSGVSPAEAAQAADCGPGADESVGARHGQEQGASGAEGAPEVQAAHAERAEACRPHSEAAGREEERAAGREEQDDAEQEEEEEEEEEQQQQQQQSQPQSQQQQQEREEEEEEEEEENMHDWAAAALAKYGAEAHAAEAGGEPAQEAAIRCEGGASTQDESGCKPPPAPAHTAVPTPVELRPSPPASADDPASPPGMSSSPNGSSPASGPGSTTPLLPPIHPPALESQGRSGAHATGVGGEGKASRGEGAREDVEGAGRQQGSRGGVLGGDGGSERPGGGGGLARLRSARSQQAGEGQVRAQGTEEGWGGEAAGSARDKGGPGSARSRGSGRSGGGVDGGRQPRGVRDSTEELRKNVVEAVRQGDRSGSAVWRIVAGVRRRLKAGPGF